MTTPKSPDRFNTELDFQTACTLKNLEYQSVFKNSDFDKQRVVFGRILLNDGISVTNFYTSWAFVAFLGFIMISSTTLEPEFINRELGVPSKDLGQKTAQLYLCDYMIRLLFALAYGVMIDNYGRKFVLTIGLILSSLGFLLIPNLSTSLFPGYYMGKAVFSSGIIALQMLPFAADYVHNSTKGIMTGLTFGVGFAGGAIASGIIKLLIKLDFAYKTIYWILAVIILIAGFFIRFGIKGGNEYYKIEKSELDIVIDEKTSKWMEVKQAFKGIPWISIALLFGILGNTDLYIMTTGLIIWIKSLVQPEEDPTVIATSFQALFFGLSFIVTAVLAVKVDKIPHMIIILPVLLFSTLGFTFVPFIHRTNSVLFYPFFVIEGLTLPAILVYSTYLSARYNPPRVRGTISGISNGIGFLGAILILSLGGYLHDYWRNDASFLIYWMLLFFTLIMVPTLYFIITRTNRKRLRKTPSMEDIEENKIDAEE